jgi:hypothetical protein
MRTEPHMYTYAVPTLEAAHNLPRQPDTVIQVLIVHVVTVTVTVYITEHVHTYSADCVGFISWMRVRNHFAMQFTITVRASA